MLQNTLGLQQIKHSVSSVATIIGVHQKVLNSDGLMIGYPFKDKRTLVFHRCDNGGPGSIPFDFLYVDLGGTNRFVVKNIGRHRQQ